MRQIPYAYHGKMSSVIMGFLIASSAMSLDWVFMCLLYFSYSFPSHHKASWMMEDTGKNAVWKMTLPVMFCMSRAFFSLSAAWYDHCTWTWTSTCYLLLIYRNNSSGLKIAISHWQGAGFLWHFLNGHFTFLCFICNEFLITSSRGLADIAVSSWAMMTVPISNLLILHMDSSPLGHLTSHQASTACYQT